MKQIANFIFGFINFTIKCFALGVCISFAISGGVCAILENSFLKRVKWILLAGIAMYLLIQMGISIAARRNKEESRC